jgi:hypothetical protein
MVNLAIFINFAGLSFSDTALHTAIPTVEVQTKESKCHKPRRRLVFQLHGTFIYSAVFMGYNTAAFDSLTRTLSVRHLSLLIPGCPGTSRSRI